jgi:hypothetical protein
MSGPVRAPVLFMLAAVDSGRVVVAPVGTPLDLDDPAWSRPAPRDVGDQLAASWPGPVQPAATFDPLPGITAVSVVMLLADGASHRFLIETPQGAAARTDRAPADLPGFDLGPCPPVVPRAYPWQVAFAFSIPNTPGSAVTYSAPGASPPAPASTLPRAVVERQVILDRIRDLCRQGRAVADGGPALVWVRDVMAVLEDPDPLGHL